MRVTIKPSSMVKPAEPTWSGRLALSELDQTGMTTHVPTIYFYTQPSDDWNTVLQTLITSLTTTLVHFYPLAGRLSSIAGGRLELDCNSAGVQLTEAYADIKLVDLDDLLESPMINKLIPSVDYRQTPLEDTPLLLLQVTRFCCGSWSLGFCISHVVVDGQSALHFLSEWARVCRGGLVASPPYLDRKILRAGESPITTCSSIHQYGQFIPPPILIGQSSNKNERRKKTTVAMMKLTETLVTKLRNKANQSRKNEGGHCFTRYEAVTAHTWRTACMIRNHESEQPTAIGICIDVRSKMKPPLPEKYFGNAIIDVIATGTSGEIVSKSLGYVSSKIKEAIEKVNDEYVSSMIDFLKNQEDLSKFQDLQWIRDDGGPFYGNPNLGVISWLTLPMHGVDFGWGKELFTGPGTGDAVDGDFLILRGEEASGSLVVASCLQVRHMEDFKRVFYQSIED
ncbi:spermidine hydroxycinnamoyl transferase-like [Cynara cardunculus var. scolymus]|uniref:Chloramphenicol acetyltransferase-like domain-containing protein n=1 Tax=Cynara cardunculus var. scolymus TaxID=59895 RepID=A0A103VN98_CYNCS|nr:spermidine hydroxycinnamoyl transferase-like [Cynara cardunculus var. scolymus]KVH57169.1 Chloramphenicol acetyltransferase-like domain-containing protein [Cynara cardunculus var. scolymus]